MWASLIFAVFVVLCYLVGSIPFMVLIARPRGLPTGKGVDLHMLIWGRLGSGWGLLAVGFDVVAKGVVPVLAGFYLNLLPVGGFFQDFPVVTVMGGGLASLTGQMWPVFNRFDGEKGNTVCLGLYATATALFGWYLMWLIFIPPLVGAGWKLFPRLASKIQGDAEPVIGGPPSKSLPLGIILGFLAMPVVSCLTGRPVEMTVALVIMNVLIIVRRLTADGLKEDLRTGGTLGSILWNRFLYDRSFV